MQWQKIADAEVGHWSAMSAEKLVSELHNIRVYEVEVESKRYQVEVQIIENTDDYVHVAVGVDDGSLPVGIFPSSSTFIRQKVDVSI